MAIYETPKLVMPETIIKRDGREVPFDISRIANALRKCFQGVGEYDIDRNPRTLLDLEERILNLIKARNHGTPTVEGVQDIVEVVLQSAGYHSEAKAYILYRHEHAKQRAERDIDPAVRAAFDDSKLFFPTTLQEFQFYDKYSRFNYELGRRETWVETVNRTVDYLYELAGDRLEREVYERIRTSILEMRAMPSMRLLAMAGAAARRNNICIYNCSYLPIDAWEEGLIISMCGCGVGFSVESRYVDQLPRVARFNPAATASVWTVEDTAEGWAEALRLGLYTWFDGRDVNFDFSELRPAGAPLKTKGGRSSGPEPLRLLLRFVRDRILRRQGRRLTPLDAHDIMCAVGSAAVSGGVRRTAMISLFDMDDEEMRSCKSGNFSIENSQRWNANNSAVWEADSLTPEAFMRQFLEMVESRGGEPGIFSREATNLTRPARRQKREFGTNPCGEIVLRPWQFCNLSIAVARPDDTEEQLRDKVEVATIIGTIQSLATHFPGLRPMWRENCEEERLLGVDITGQLDSAVATRPHYQRQYRQVAVTTNREYAMKLGINQSASVTCVKPSGNSSQLLNCSSGIHARWSPYYIRNVRVSSTSPVCKIFRDAGAPMDPENGQTPETANTWVIHFPVRAPRNAITRDAWPALKQCEYWLQVKREWTEHNPSVTITYTPDEIMDVMKWVWDHRDYVGGMAFLPKDDASYEQMPYVEITKEEYERSVASFPVIDFAKLTRYEHEDLTTAAQELACVSGQCDI
jgi:ribonucleoside-triphosphate reductase